MIPAGYISIKELEEHFGASMPLVREFIEYGLVEVSVQEEQECLATEQAEILSRLLRLHNELGVNKEGIEVIEAMRQRMLDLNREVEKLRQQMQHLHEEHFLHFVEAARNRGLFFDVDAVD